MSGCQVMLARRVWQPVGVFSDMVWPKNDGFSDHFDVERRCRCYRLRCHIEALYTDAKSKSVYMIAFGDELGGVVVDVAKYYLENGALREKSTHRTRCLESKFLETTTTPLCHAYCRNESVDILQSAGKDAIIEAKIASTLQNHHIRPCSLILDTHEALVMSVSVAVPTAVLLLVLRGVHHPLIQTRRTSSKGEVHAVGF